MAHQMPRTYVLGHTKIPKDFSDSVGILVFGYSFLFFFYGYNILILFWISHYSSFLDTRFFLSKKKAYFFFNVISIVLTLTCLPSLFSNSSESILIPLM